MPGSLKQTSREALLTLGGSPAGSHNELTYETHFLFHGMAAALPLALLIKYVMLSYPYRRLNVFSHVLVANARDLLSLFHIPKQAACCFLSYFSRCSFLSSCFYNVLRSLPSVSISLHVTTRYVITLHSYFLGNAVSRDRCKAGCDGRVIFANVG